MASNRFEMPVRYGSPGDPIIRMRTISKTFHTAAGATTVLKDINVDILQGQFISVVGRSGSGKSTLVNMITGIDRPSSGTVEIGNQKILQMHESDMAIWRGKNLGIVFQFFQLLPMLTLIENVMLPMDFCNIYSPASREERALDLLHQVGLDGLAYKLPGAVAGGQQQCAAVARALANDPPILIADEPTGNLDSNTAEQVMDIFEELVSQGKTILIVTHDRSLAQRTNRRLLISDGELVSEMLYQALPNAPHSQLLRLNKLAVPLYLAPGAPLPKTATPAGPVYLVTEGEIISSVHGEKISHPAGSIVDPLSARQSLYAGDRGTKLLALPREDVGPLLPGSEQAPLAIPTQNENRSGVRTWWRRTRRLG